MVLDQYVVALDIASFTHALPKRAHEAGRRVVRRCVPEESDHRHRRLLRARRERPPSRATQQGEELASS
jgi:hypothetical protein